MRSVHYDPTDAPGRKLPLLATARGAILSLVTPQLRFTIKGQSLSSPRRRIPLTLSLPGTDASFVKFGIDVQEDQLKEFGASAVSRPDFGVEPESLCGTLYTLADPSKPTTVPTLDGAYRDWFVNVAEAVRAGDPSLLQVTPEQAALTIQVIELAMQSSKEGRTIKL